MNNSFSRLIDGMCATLRTEVLSRLDDEFARGQVFGVINLLDTFKVRADWSSAFLLEQLEVQRTALDGVAAAAQAAGVANTLPSRPEGGVPVAAPIAALLAARDEGNQAITALLAWVDDQRATLGAKAIEVDRLLREAMRAEVSIELKHSPRPLFAEMSSGRED